MKIFGYVLIVGLVIVGGVFAVKKYQPKTVTNDSKVGIEHPAPQLPSADQVITPTPNPPQQESQPKPMSTAPDHFTGTILENENTAVLYEFSQHDYDLAVAQGKIIYLFFYSDDCLQCGGELQQSKVEFSEMHNDNIVGFRVYFDSDRNTKALAGRFLVTQPLTKVVVKNGQLFSSEAGWLNEDDIEKQILAATK